MTLYVFFKAFVQIAITMQMFIAECYVICIRYSVCTCVFYTVQRERGESDRVYVVVFGVHYSTILAKVYAMRCSLHYAYTL